MSPALFAGLAVAAGVICSLHMWWHKRRGRQAPDGATNDIAALQARQAELAAQIARLEAHEHAPALGTRSRA